MGGPIRDISKIFNRVFCFIINNTMHSMPYFIQKL